MGQEVAKSVLPSCAAGRGGRGGVGDAESERQRLAACLRRTEAFLAHPEQLEKECDFHFRRAAGGLDAQEGATMRRVELRRLLWTFARGLGSEELTWETIEATAVVGTLEPHVPTVRREEFFRCVLKTVHLVAAELARKVRALEAHLLQRQLGPPELRGAEADAPFTAGRGPAPAPAGPHGLGPGQRGGPAAPPPGGSGGGAAAASSALQGEDYRSRDPSASASSSYFSGSEGSRSRSSSQRSSRGSGTRRVPGPAEEEPPPVASVGPHGQGSRAAADEEGPQQDHKRDVRTPRHDVVPEAREPAPLLFQPAPDEVEADAGEDLSGSAVFNPAPEEDKVGAVGDDEENPLVDWINVLTLSSEGSFDPQQLKVGRGVLLLSTREEELTLAQRLGFSSSSGHSTLDLSLLTSAVSGEAIAGTPMAALLPGYVRSLEALQRMLVLTFGATASGAPDGDEDEGWEEEDEDDGEALCLWFGTVEDCALCLEMIRAEAAK